MATSYITGLNNKKSIQMLADVPGAWTTVMGGGHEEQTGLQRLQKSVPWLYRGWNLRMLSVAEVPFVIYKGEQEYDNSLMWENKLGWWDNPRKTIMLAESALTLFGRAYFFKNPALANNPLELRYWLPTSVTPILDDVEGLTGFKRRWNKGEREYGIEDILYIWGIDPFVEIGPPQSSPASAAIAAAGVLWGVDEFSAAFFERGAIKATILSVPHGTMPSEKERLEKWYTRAINGIKNAWSTKVLNADAVTATTIGEGIKELENTVLTKEKREDISTALGIPQSKMFSTSSTDTNRTEDEKSMLRDMTIPECKLIEAAFNEQVFIPLGYRMEFKPETLDVFQEDEQDRSTATLNYVSAFGKQKAGIVAEMMGLDLPDGVEYEDLNSEPMPAMPFVSPQEARQNTRDEEKEEERKQFARWAKKRNPKDWHTFKFNHLDEVEQIDLIGAQVPQDDRDTEKLVKSLTDILDEIRGNREQPVTNITVNTPDVKVNIPEKEVTVNVPEAKVTNEINIPETKTQEIPAPVVNITNQVEPTPVVVENKIDVDIPEPKPRKTRVKRDDYGNIVEMETNNG